MGLFDLRPKTRREDLFDRERELKELYRGVERGYPIIALLGVRRIGKTSVLRVFLSEVSGVYVDMRGVVKRCDLEARLSESMSSSLSKLKRFLEGIRGVSVSGLSLEIKWRGRDSISFAGLLAEINKRGERFVVVLDELQFTKPPLSYELKKIIAYAYDNLKYITFIVAGSEIGLLRDFLGYEDPSSPLYGRAVHEVVVERFSREESREFLMRGFREEGVIPPLDLLDKAIEFFNGIPGWLVLFGRRYVDGYRDIEVLKEIAITLAREELNKLNLREKIVLKAIASGCKSWSQIRYYIVEKYGIIIPKATLTRIIEKLEKLSIIKNYEFQDPVYREAATRITPTPR